MAHPRFSLWGQFRRISSAALAVTLITPGSSHAQAIYLDFSSNGGNSSGYWSLSATDGDFYQAGSILVATDGGVVNSNSPANENWGWGDSRDCDGFGCGGPIVHLTTVTFVGDINLVDFFDFGKVTILQNDGGMTFTADKGLSRTFAAGDIWPQNIRLDRDFRSADPQSSKPVSIASEQQHTLCVH